MPTVVTPQEARKRLMRAAARREMCEQQALEKLRLWQISGRASAEIMSELTAKRYIDNNRYARAYAREKLSYGNWGARKVETMLRSKGIDDETIREAIAENLDADQQQEKLLHLIEQKRSALRNEPDEYKKKQKIIRFAMYRGYNYDEIVNIL